MDTAKLQSVLAKQYGSGITIDTVNPNGSVLLKLPTGAYQKVSGRSVDTLMRRDGYVQELTAGDKATRMRRDIGADPQYAERYHQAVRSENPFHQHNGNRATQNTFGNPDVGKTPLGLPSEREGAVTAGLPSSNTPKSKPSGHGGLPSGGGLA